jgi:hypothetical protein
VRDFDPEGATCIKVAEGQHTATARPDAPVPEPAALRSEDLIAFELQDSQGGDVNEACLRIPQYTGAALNIYWPATLAMRT